MNETSKTLIDAILHRQLFIKAYVPYAGTLSLLVQFISLLAFILMASSAQINGLVKGPVNWLAETIQTNSFISIGASLLLIALTMSICWLLWVQSSMQLTVVLDGHHRHSRIVGATSCVCLVFQLISFPTLIIIIINWQDGLDDFKLVLTNGVAAICIFVAVIIEPQRYFYHYKILPICLALFASIYLFLLAFFALSVYFGFRETDRLKKIAYLELAWVLLLELIATQASNTIETLHLATISLSIAVYLLIVPRKGELGEVQENDLLLAFIQRLNEQASLKDEDYRTIYRIIYRFKASYEQNNLQKEIYRREDLAIFVAAEREITKQSLSILLLRKLSINIEKREFFALSRMQRVVCAILNGGSLTSLISQVQQLKRQSELSFTLEERLKFAELIVRLQSFFIPPQKALNSRNMMAIEKQIEVFYDELALVMDNVQFVWHRMKSRGLRELKLREITRQILSSEERCVAIIRKLIPFRKMKTEIEAFNYLMTLIHVHYQFVVEWKQVTFSSREKLNHTSYINLVDHAIVDISNSLANETHFVRNELIGKSIQEVFPKKLRDYIASNIQTLANKSSDTKEIVMPLVIEGISEYILPVRSKFDILLDLESGFQFIIQILDSADLRKLPMFLYSIQSDQITNTTSNFYQYLSLPSLSTGSIQGSELFDIDLGAFISEYEQPIGLTLSCFIKLNKLNKSMKNIQRVYELQKVNLKLLQLYDTGSQKMALIQLRLKSRQNMGTNVSLAQFLNRQQIQTNISKVRPTRKLLKKETFCEIPNRFASEINEKLSDRNDPLRVSYVKIIWVLLILIIGTVLSVLIFTHLKISAAGSGLSQIMNKSINTNTKIQQIYLLIYQYSQYYQIINFPSQFLAIQAYNMTALNSEYKKKALANVNLLLQQLYSDDLGQSHLSYQLEFEQYSTVANTSRVSIVKLMQDVTFAISTNNPVAMVRNEDIIDPIIQSFHLPSFNEIIDLVDLQFHVFLWSVTAMVVIILLIKGCLLHLQSIVWEVLDLYDQIPPELVVESETQLDKYKQVLEQSCLFSKRESGHFDAVQLRHEKQAQAQMSNAEPQGSGLLGSASDKVPGKLKLQRQPLLKVLLQNNKIWMVPLIMLLFFSFYYYAIQVEKDQMIQIANYGQSLQNSITLIIERTQKFFQRAMEGILPVEQRTVIAKEVFRDLSMNYYSGNTLPSFFNDYMLQVSKMLGTNLCAYSYLNTGSLYKNINCSRILNGIMDTGFQEAYAAYFDLVEQNLGVSIKDLGVHYRIGATYPVYMQICYQRRTMNNMLIALQTQFNILVPQYVTQRNDYMTQIVYVGLCLLPIIFLIVHSFVQQCRELCEFGIKCFQLIPRKFLLKRVTTKLLMKQETLDKISRFF